MATVVPFPECNADFGPPPGLDEMVGRLPCFVNGKSFVSAWQFSPEEIKQIVETGVAYFSVVAGSSREGKPIVLPIYVGADKEDVRQVTADFGPTW